MDPCTACTVDVELVPRWVELYLCRRQTQAHGWLTMYFLVLAPTSSRSASTHHYSLCCLTRYFFHARLLNAFILLSCSTLSPPQGDPSD